MGSNVKRWYSLARSSSSAQGAHRYQNGTYSVLTERLNGTYYALQRYAEKRKGRLTARPIPLSFIFPGRFVEAGFSA